MKGRVSLSHCSSLDPHLASQSLTLKKLSERLVAIKQYFWAAKHVEQCGKGNLAWGWMYGFFFNTFPKRKTCTNTQWHVTCDTRRGLTLDNDSDAKCRDSKLRKDGQFQDKSRDETMRVLLYFYLLRLPSRWEFTISLISSESLTRKYVVTGSSLSLSVEGKVITNTNLLSFWPVEEKELNHRLVNWALFLMIYHDSGSECLAIGFELSEATPSLLHHGCAFFDWTVSVIDFNAVSFPVSCLCQFKLNKIPTAIRINRR